LSDYTQVGLNTSFGATISGEDYEFTWVYIILVLEAVGHDGEKEIIFKHIYERY
jgi:hypothetical protein